MNFVIMDRETPATSSSPMSVKPDSAAPSISAAISQAAPDSEDLRAKSRAAREQALREQRWSERIPFGRGGFIGVGPEGATIACCVRNISRFGAMIEVDPAQASEVPDTFVLSFMSNRIRSEANCLLRWRSDASVGVTFAGPVKTVVMRDSN